MKVAPAGFIVNSEAAGSSRDRPQWTCHHIDCNQRRRGRTYSGTSRSYCWRGFCRHRFNRITFCRLRLPLAYDEIRTANANVASYRGPRPLLPNQTRATPPRAGPILCQKGESGLRRRYLRLPSAALRTPSRESDEGRCPFARHVRTFATTLPSPNRTEGAHQSRPGTHARKFLEFLLSDSGDLCEIAFTVSDTPAPSGGALHQKMMYKQGHRARPRYFRRSARRTMEKVLHRIRFRQPVGCGLLCWRTRSAWLRS